MLSGIDVWHC